MENTAVTDQDYHITPNFKISAVDKFLEHFSERANIAGMDAEAWKNAFAALVIRRYINLDDVINHEWQEAIDTQEELEYSYFNEIVHRCLVAKREIFDDWRDGKIEDVVDYASSD